MFFVMSWNSLEHTSRVLLSACLETNEHAEALFHDFSPSHLSSALKLAASKCDDECRRENLEHFIGGYEVLMNTRNTIVHNLIGVLPADDGVGCVGLVLGQRVRAKHELVEFRVSEAVLSDFVKDCYQFVAFADFLIAEVRPTKTDLELAIKSAARELGNEENMGVKPDLPCRLNLKRRRLDHTGEFK